MAETSTIEWTDATWQPITGCSVVSSGCTNCYAMRLAGTRLRKLPSRVGLTRSSKAGPVWTGEVRLNEKWLTQPLTWRQPKKIFVCAHGDLFAEAVPDAWIDRVFAVMALAPQHTFQVLTKRAARMRAYMADAATMGRVIAASDALMDEDCEAANSGKQMPLINCGMMGTMIMAPSGAKWIPHWPLPNVWLGVSAEDQRRADERVPYLLATPAAVRFVSAEPLLGPVDFRRLGHNPIGGEAWDALAGSRGVEDPGDSTYAGGITYRRTARLDWIIVGGESGPGARPMHPAWPSEIRNACGAAGVPFFFKQWGAFGPEGLNAQRWLWRPDGSCSPDPLPEGIGRHFKSGWSVSYRVGKNAAGRLLDGVEHNGMPDPQPAPRPIAIAE